MNWMKLRRTRKENERINIIFKKLCKIIELYGKGKWFKTNLKKMNDYREKRMKCNKKGLKEIVEDEWVWKRMNEYERGWMSMKEDGRGYRGLWRTEEDWWSFHVVLWK